MLQDQTTRLTLELISPSTGVIQANEQRFESARKNLEQVDLVGVTEEYDRFLARLHDRYGWRIDRIGHLNASEVREATPAFRKRIAEDNRLDMDLYETARSLATSLRR